MIWRRVFVEGFVIVSSILLAFAIDAGWDRRNQRVDEADILTALEAEFAQHLDIVERRAESNRAFVDRLSRLTRTMAGQAEWPSVTEFDALVANVAVLSPTWDPGAGEREALIQSGRLGLISDTELRVALASWGSVVDEVRDGELVIREFVREAIIPYLAERGVGLGRAIDRLVPGVATPESDPEAERQYRDMMSDARFRTLVEYRLAWQIDTMGGYEEAVEATARIVDLLERRR